MEPTYILYLLSALTRPLDGGYQIKAAKYMDEEILLKKGINLLIKEPGPVEALRFINIPKKERMEVVKRHRQWQTRLDKDRFYNEIFKN